MIDRLMPVLIVIGMIEAIIVVPIILYVVVWSMRGEK